MEAALATEDKVIAILSQRDETVDDPTVEQLFPIGTLAVIKKMTRAEEGLQLIVQGLGCRFCKDFRGKVTWRPNSN